MDVVDREPAARPAAFVADRVNRHRADFNRSEPIDKHRDLAPAKDPQRQQTNDACDKNRNRDQNSPHSLFDCSHGAACRAVARRRRVSPCLFRNPNIEYRNPKQTAEIQISKRHGYSHFRRMAPKMFISSLASAESCWRLRSSFAIDIKQAQPIASFLGFSSANLDLHHKVLLAERFICFDVVCANRTRGTDELLRILDIADSPRQSFDKRATFLSKQSGSLLQVVWLCVIVASIQELLC